MKSQAPTSSLLPSSLGNSKETNKVDGGLKRLFERIKEGWLSLNTKFAEEFTQDRQKEKGLNDSKQFYVIF